jgi:3-hydroxyisobutyrate dehydrogenase
MPATRSAETETVAVLGAGGTMGLPVARNLARAGFAVRAWNRSREKAEPLARDGAVLCESPAQAADGAGVVLTMLSDMDAVLESIQAALAGASGGAVWWQMSTIGETGTEQCIELARENQLIFLDAPVLGTKQPAEEGKLVVLASGPDEIKDRVQPLFDAVGQRTMWLGEPPLGTRLKLVSNSWVLAVTEAAAEAIALAEGLELDPSLLFDALDGGALDLPYLRIKGKAILERNLEPMFRLKLAAKDAVLVEESAQRNGLELPLFTAVRRQMSEAAKTHGDEDMAATYFASAPRRRSP